MKTAVKIATILIFIVLGWFLAEYMLKWFLSPIKEMGLSVISTKHTEQFQLRIFFALILGLVPVLIWILSRVFNYKNKYFEGTGYLFMIGFGILFLKLRSMLLLKFITNTPGLSNNAQYSLDSLWVNQYLSIGILVGCIFFIASGLLFKQMTLKQKNEKQKRLAEEDIGRIGRS